MARRIMPPAVSTRRVTASVERALIREMRVAAVELRDDFIAMARRTDLLEDIHRMAGAEEGRFAEAARASGGSAHTTKQSDVDLPAAALRAVELALQRSRRFWDEFELQLRASLLSGSIRSFEAGAQGPINQIGFEGTFELRNPKVLDYLLTRANMLSGGIADTTFDAIRNTIVRGFYVDMKNPLDVARDLRAQFEFLGGPRSRNIARTETLIASEQGLYEQHYSIGVESKIWLSIADQLTRDSHLEVNRSVVNIFEPFQVRNATGGFDEMLHPGDPTASPENLCHCRCGSGGVIETSEASAPWLGD